MSNSLWSWRGKIVRVYPERYVPTEEELEGYSRMAGRPITREDMNKAVTENAREVGYHSGTIAKVVMVSRLGDVGLTRKLKTEHGYDIRFYPECLEEVSAEEIQQP